MENLVRAVENADKAGQKVFGYNFRCCGVQRYYDEVNNTNSCGASSMLKETGK